LEIFDSMNKALAALHCVDFKKIGQAFDNIENTKITQN